MTNYIIIYRDAGVHPLSAPLAFACQADDMDHAEEQCLNAYPGADILWWHEGHSFEEAMAEYFDNPPMQYAVAYGNPVDGFFFVGPFKGRDAAVEYGESEAIARDLWIVELTPPAV
jgi:hypothetical protein